MAEAASEYHNQELAERRLLTEADHFLEHMDEYGNVPDGVFEDVMQNRTTAAQEIAMPYAVTTTEHEIVERTGEAGRRERVIMWLGRTALDVAASGYKFHFSEAAFQRIAVEKDEAIHTQDNLRAGVAQVLISPKMTRHDASEAVAKAEHLYADDAIRTSTAITDEQGKVVGRRLQSLLVRGIPFPAWVKMLKDPDNIFGKAFGLRDELSAVSVMELFSQMELPEDKLPEGPVTLVEAVLPYIDDELARQKVKRQLGRFRGSQELYTHEAKEAGREWAVFDLELARSLKQRRATDTLRFFIMHNAGAWNDEALATIEQCLLGDTQYEVTTQLAALLSRAKQKLLGDQLAVVTDNDMAIRNVSAAVRQKILTNHHELKMAQANGADVAHIRNLQWQQTRLLQGQVIDSGGGCAGRAESAFALDRMAEGRGVGEVESPFKANAEDKSNWKWKRGVCQVKACPSPKPTEVGPCSVCRACQSEFDHGRDPTKTVAAPSRRSLGATATVTSIWSAPKPRQNKPSPKTARKTANFLTAA